MTNRVSLDTDNGTMSMHIRMQANGEKKLLSGPLNGLD